MKTKGAIFVKRLFAVLLSIIMLISVASAEIRSSSADMIHSFDFPIYYHDSYDNPWEFSMYHQYRANGVGRVYNCWDDEYVLPNVSGDHMLLDSWYVLVENNSKYAVYNIDSGKKITDWYTEISNVENHIAVCGEGEWVPPGRLRGNYGAVNLKTGKTVVPLKWWGGVKISPDGEHLIGYGDGYGVYTRDGKDVTETVGAVPYEKNGDYYTTIDAKNELFGLSDKDGNELIAPQFKSVRNAFSGALVAFKDGYYGAVSADGTEEVLAPFKYLDFAAYGNDIFALKEYGYIADNNFQNEVEVYYGDGGRAPIYGYASLQFSLGDVLFMKKYGDNTLYCISKTGQVLDFFENGFLAFYADTHDYVLVGNTEVENSFIVVNKWGERLTDGRVGEVLSSDSIGGKGLSLYDMNTGKTRFLMADGFEIKDAEGILDSEKGRIIINSEDGGVIIELTEWEERHSQRKTYETIEFPQKYTLGSISRDVTGYVCKLLPEYADDFAAYELYRAKTTYYHDPHEWAKEEIEEIRRKERDAVYNDVVWYLMEGGWVPIIRDGCTREQFCIYVMNMLKACGYEEEGNIDISFKDTDNKKVLQAARLGIVNGIGNGRFAPNRPVTREAAATMLYRAAKLLGLKENTKNIEFSDSGEISPWAREAVNCISAMKNGETAIMQGVGNNTFSPKGMYSNEQSYITMLRIFNLYMGIYHKI